METLVRETLPVPSVELPATSGAPAGGPDGAPATGEARACEVCGAGMARGQDWCLECGTAAPGRLRTRPGLRPAVTILGATLLLASGAVAASYAALSGDAHRQAALPSPASAAPVAQPLPQIPPAPSPPVAPAPVAPPAFSVRPVLPPVATPPVLPVAPLPPRATVPPAATPRPPAPRKPAGPQRIAFGADAMTLYDPYGAATASGDPADAYDKDLKTSWFVTTNDGDRMGVGLLIDLEKTRNVEKIDLATSTPGYRIEVYGSERDRPADVLDTRWNHVTNRSRVDETKRDGTVAGDGFERIALRDRAGEFRYILLWFTTPPDAGATVRISEIAVSG